MSWSGLSDTGKNDLSSLLLFVLLADILLFSSSFCFDAKALINNAWLFFWYSLPMSLLGAESEKIVAAAQRPGEKPRGGAQRLPSSL